MFSVKIIADSLSMRSGRPERLTTFQLTYPRFIHAELMTHRMFSRNAMSSRAVPVAKMIEQVRNNPAMPVHWGKNQPGMQAAVELTGKELTAVQCAWGEAAHQAANIAEKMTAAGAHKQVVNRILEPFQWMHTIVTTGSAGYDNFKSLRCHPAAEPNFQKLAYMMDAERAISEPVELVPGQWHLPFVNETERRIYALEVLLAISTARCARVSYLNHDGTNPDLNKDIELCQKLIGSHPMHASPAEHQATPDGWNNNEGWVNSILHGNLPGWVQHRKAVEMGTNVACLNSHLKELAKPGVSPTIRLIGD